MVNKTREKYVFCGSCANIGNKFSKNTLKVLEVSNNQE